MDEERTTQTFVGNCPVLEVLVEDVKCIGLLDTGSQVTLMQHGMLKKYFPHYQMGQAPILTLKAANGLEIPYVGYAVLNFEIAGVQIPERGVVIVRDECSSYPMIIGMNVLSACWNNLFQEQEQLRLKQHSHRDERDTWRRTFASCQRIAAQVQRDGFVGNVWSASRCRVRVPPGSEIIVWGRVRAGNNGQEYCGLVEPMPDQDAVGVARTIAKVRHGRVPVRLCNVHPYDVFIGRFQKLGKLYEVQPADVHGQCDLKLSSSSEGVVEVSVIETVPVGTGGSTFEVSQLTTHTDLTTSQQAVLSQLLHKWSSVFSQSEEDFGCTDAIQHCIPTGDALPSRERFRPLPPNMYQEMRVLLADMLDKGVISESSSPWAAPVVMVRKKDGSWRFCVDYRKLNAVTHKDAFPLPRIEETLTTLTQAEWFTTLDLASGYWQVGVHPDDQPKTAFATPLGLYHFRRMPFGLCNAPATFQRLMQHCLRGQVAEFLFVYLDDIIIHSADFSLHVQHLEQVFERLSRYGLKLRSDKCKLFRRQVKFLGHVVNKQGVHPDPEKVAAVQEWATPTTIREVRAFLGLAGYYRRFIDGFAKLARPLNSLLVGVPVNRKSSHRGINWTPECQNAFECLKSCLLQAPILAYADFSAPFIVYTDASSQGLGAVLSQMQDGRERVIAYASRSLHPSEKNDANYSSFKLELLALKWAVTEKFRDYLMGSKFMVMTDNNPVAHLQSAKLGATEQRFPCVRVPPGANVVTAELQEVTAEQDMAIGGVDWQQAQEQDEEICTVKRYVDAGIFPKVTERRALPRTVQQLLRQRSRFQSKDGLLHRLILDPCTNEPHLQIVCPKRWQKEVWERYHEATGHAGVEKTLLRIRNHFYWPQMEEKVRGFHSGCVSCGLQKGKGDPKAPLHPINVSFPLEVLALDFLSLGRSNDTYQNILVAIDMFTRYAWAIPTRDQTAQTTVKALWSHVIQTFGCPLRFHSDRGPNFESALFQQLCEVYGITRSRTTSYHPAGNGRVERMNQTLLHMLRTLEVEKQDRWPAFLPELLQAYNNTVHSATGFTPSYLMFGRVVRTPVDMSLGVEERQSRKSWSGWVQDHHQKLKWAPAADLGAAGDGAYDGGHCERVGSSHTLRASC
uniref:Gypsy retrotransposon integrase-like protein 1 n=1 Tax=Astyanax mexicanus TaxID=7994 RepID=A0A3B1KBC2_ASTMX